MEKVKYLTEQWETYDGRIVTFNDIDQQHLSNTYWFMKIVWKAKDFMLWQIFEQLEKRFNGQVLNYAPRADFKEEIKYLRDRGMVTSNNEIVYNGEVIGRINLQIEDK